MSTLRGEKVGIALTIGLLCLHFFFRRFRKLQRRVIRHRDQKAMIAYARRLKRNKIKLSRDDIPIGNHLLMSGLLVPTNGNVYDIGFPGWLTVRLPKESDKSIKLRLQRVAKKMSRTNKPRKEPLAKGWWLKVGKDPSAGGCCYAGYRPGSLLASPPCFPRSIGTRPSYRSVK